MTPWLDWLFSFWFFTLGQMFKLRGNRRFHNSWAPLASFGRWWQAIHPMLLRGLNELLKVVQTRAYCNLRGPKTQWRRKDCLSFSTCSWDISIWQRQTTIWFATSLRGCKMFRKRCITFFVLVTWRGACVKTYVGICRKNDSLLHRFASVMLLFKLRNLSSNSFCNSLMWMGTLC